MTYKGGTQHLWDVKAAMRDGVALSSDIYLPEGGVNGGPYPVVLHRTPYDNQNEPYVKQAEFFAERGYAVVLQDVRGRNDSEGTFYPFHFEGTDGFDTIEWIAEQPWSTGKIGMLGGSYGGWVQWAAAREVPPHLTTIVSSATAGRWMREVPYNHGMLSLAMFTWFNFVGARSMQSNYLIDWNRVLTHLPLRTMDQAMGRPVVGWQDWLDHPTLDEYWQQILFKEEDFAAMDIPALHLSGWYDGECLSTLFFYEGMRRHSPAREKQHALIGPWGHRETRIPKQYYGEVDFSIRALTNINAAHLTWFDHWLKDSDTGLQEQKRVKYFVMGDNEWEEAEDWPVESNRRLLYLHSGGAANSLRGDGRLMDSLPDEQPNDEYAYDPMQVESVGEMVANWFPPPGTPERPIPSMDRRPVEIGTDKVVYTGDELEAPLKIAGTLSLTLYAGSDCLDTDWVAVLSDVWPNGRSIPISRGLLRARFRDGLETEILMEPGATYEFRIELSPAAHIFKVGHRLRLTISSSDFPLHDRNLNTGEPIADAVEYRVANNFVCHDTSRPSHLDLPVVAG